MSTIGHCSYCNTPPSKPPIIQKRGWKGTDLYFVTNYALYECDNCGLIWADPLTKETVEGLRRYYAEYYNSSDRGYRPAEEAAAVWRVPFPRRAVTFLLKPLRAFQRWVTNEPFNFGTGRAPEALSLLRKYGVYSVLDIGAAFGSFVRYCLVMGPDAYGIEPDIKVVNAIRDCSVNRIFQGFFPEQSGPLAHYDALTILASMCYMHDLSPMHFQTCREKLNPGGILIIFDHDGDRIRDPEMLGSSQSALTLNFKGERFMRRAAHDGGFSEYQRILCRGEPLFCFHVMFNG